MVRAVPDPTREWVDAVIPILIVEILSPSTRRRDRLQKRNFYLEVGVAEYWLVDPDDRTITTVSAGRVDIVANTTLSWQPHVATEPLKFQLGKRFLDSNMALSDYLRTELKHAAERLSFDELRDRLARLQPVTVRERPARVIRRERDRA